MFPGAETVTVIRPAARGLHGDPGTDPDTEFDVDGCLISPGATSETTFQAETVTSGLTLYRESPTDLLPTDKVRVRGVVYDVFGQLRVWGDAGIEVDLETVSG